MTSLKEYIINEKRGKVINDQWINDQKPVMTKDGRNVMITKVDLSEVPNIIHGKVRLKNNKVVNYQWDDKGICVKATDIFGNPKKPEESDALVKAI